MTCLSILGRFVNKARTQTDFCFDGNNYCTPDRLGWVPKLQASCRRRECNDNG